MKGILLAGGSGTRLRPLTGALSKHVLPVYDKPMIYYPLSVLMLAGIRDILLITNPDDTEVFQSILGDGRRLGLRLEYAEQPEPKGIAEALVIGADFTGDDQVALVLGDNMFHGPRFTKLLDDSVRDLNGCALFGYRVRDPRQYAVGEIDESGRLLTLEEKPVRPRSDLAVTGLYMYDADVAGIAKNLTPSARGELEITDVNRAYLAQGRAHLTELGRGFAWLDMGTHESLLQAGQYVHLLEQRQGVRIACLEEVALNRGFIGTAQCRRLGEQMPGTAYGTYVCEVAERYTAAPAA
ncbi:glucose-1-phosphate thymidylyltransferase RfbA [Phytoactinopolyspora mesophila]|uniref:Glucose-1-phosphate thymidylyltransferase n=1 Tax=Phytoactinopolyspora mesophila TaxID=2650750 RepID=A0A7K3M359_9ACTN|nr:glucose-1-phosphate thymidylyltransferase RfbA [Phytoactinopolyspora mesophila]NDL56888.1 glucose-1-phosphate thymidylyltransferase RfbA [Phytoactinopolyspora mesophila]